MWAFVSEHHLVRDFFHINLLSDLCRWWKGEYPPYVIDNPYEPYLLSIACFCLDLVAAGNRDLCLSMINYLSTKL